MTPLRIGRAWRAAGLAAMLLPLLAIAAPATGATAAATAQGSANAKQAGGFSIPAPSRTLMKNGLSVLVLERHGIPLVEFRLLIKAGSASDPAGKEGVAALTARLLKRGTRSHTAVQFAEEVEFVGGAIDVQSGVETTVITGEFASRDLEIGLSLLADLAQNPVFTDTEFDKQKRLHLADILSLEDEPSAVAEQAFQGWVYGGHPYGKPQDGTRRSVETLVKADVTAFYEGRFAPNNAILAIVGDVSAQQAAQRAAHYFETWKRKNVAEIKLPEAAPIAGRKVLLVDKPDATQSQIRLGNLAIRRNDPDYFPLLVGNAVLGSGFTSWLVDEVRVKRGLTYSIRSRLEPHRAAGTLSVSTFSKNATVLDTINVSLEQMARLRDGPIPADDLDKARNYLAGRYPLRLESPDALAAEVLNVEFYGLGPDEINMYQKRVRGAGAEAVKRAALRSMPLRDLAIVVVGPAAELKKSLESLGPVTVKTVDAVLGGS
jgi:zinc protease